MAKTIELDRALIVRLGVKNLAALLGTSIQVVSNWKARGIPPGVKLERPDLFLADLPDRRRARESRKAKAA